jgi:hypothetical protein
MESLVEKSALPDDGRLLARRHDDIQKKNRDLGKPDAAVICFL